MSSISNVLESILRRIMGDNEKDFNVDCPYCDKNICFTKVFRGQYVDLKIENFYGDVTIIAYGDNTISYEPKYCPNCGRKIQENEQWNK